MTVVDDEGDDDAPPPLKAEQIVATLGKVSAAVRELRDLPFEAILRIMDREESFGCFTDPTGWSARREDVRFNRRLVEAALHLVSETRLGIQEKTRCKEKMHPLIGKHPGIDVRCPMCGEHLKAEKVDATSKDGPRLLPGPGQEVAADPPTGGGA